MQLSVLRNGRFHTSGVLANSSLRFAFKTADVVDGELDSYQIDPETFIDARGCLGISHLAARF